MFMIDACSASGKSLVRIVDIAPKVAPTHISTTRKEQSTSPGMERVQRPHRTLHTAFPARGGR
jgi:hypothetical protein